MIVKEVNVYVVETGSFRPVIVELVTDEGITGIGEGAVGFGVGCYAAGTMKLTWQKFCYWKYPRISVTYGMISLPYVLGKGPAPYFMLQ